MLLQTEQTNPDGKDLHTAWPPGFLECAVIPTVSEVGVMVIAPVMRLAGAVAIGCAAGFTTTRVSVSHRAAGSPL